LQRLILRRQQPVLQHVDKYLLQALADSRFGRRRETSMAKYQTVALLKDLEKKLISTSPAFKQEAITGAHGPFFSRSNTPLHPINSSASQLRSPTKLLHQESIPHYLTPGSRVWAATFTDPRWHGRWEAARVIEQLEDGLIKVVYHNDGMQERLLAPMLIQPYRHFVQGDKIEFLHYDGEPTWNWEEGEIDSVSPLGSYSVRAGGQVISKILGRDIRFPPLRNDLQSGDSVWAAVNKDGAPTDVVGGWAKASIVEVSSEKVLVKYDGINLWEEKRWHDVQPYFTIEEGDFVEVRLDDGAWWGAAIAGAFEDTDRQDADDSEDSEDDSENHLGTARRLFDVYLGEYDEFFEGIEESHIRPLLPLLESGTRVLANYGNEGTWFEGKIDTVNTYHRLYDIKYDDGDYEKNVPRDRLRVLYPQF